MTPAELQIFINRYFNTAVNAFNNDRMITVLLALLSAGVTAAYDTAEEFQAAVAANPDISMMAFVAQDNIYTGDEDVVLINVPGQGVGQVAVDFFT